MPAIVKQVSDEAGGGPETFICKGCEVPACFIIDDEKQYHESKIQHHDQQEECFGTVGQQVDAEQEIEGVIMDYVRLKNHHVQQTNGEQEC